MDMFSGHLCRSTAPHAGGGRSAVRPLPSPPSPPAPEPSSADATGSSVWPSWGGAVSSASWYLAKARTVTATATSNKAFNVNFYTEVSYAHLMEDHCVGKTALIV